MADFCIPPGLPANDYEISLIDFSGVQQSPLSGAIRSVSRGQRWQSRIQWHDLVGDDRANLASILAGVRGKSGRLWVADPGYTPRGSFPCPELFNNWDFENGSTSWSPVGSCTLAGFNRTLRMMMNGVSSPSAQQSVSWVTGIAYALRVCLMDGPGTAALTAGPLMSIGTVFSSVTTARGLITAAGVASSSSSGVQSLINVASGMAAGLYLSATYASMRRCALAVNPGATAYLNTLPIDALPVSTNGVLRAGDRIEVNGELKVLTFDCNSDGSGAATLQFEPALRHVVPDNAAVIIGNPMMKGIMSNDHSFPTRPGGFSDFDVTLIEAS